MEAFIEAVTPDTREQLNEILSALREDREKGWKMMPDGTYTREAGGEGTSSQEALYRYFSARKVSLAEPAEELPAIEETAAEETEAPEEQEERKDAGGLFGWLRRAFKG